MAYLCLVVFVPPLPNYYTFSIDVIGSTFNATASILLIHFLNSRPVAQKNLLNRLLALFTLTILIGTIRNVSMSFMTCFFHSELQELLDEFPFFPLSFLSMRITGNVEAVACCSLSAGRLLLFSNPVYFQTLNPNKWVITATFSAFIVGFGDFIFNWITCYAWVDTPVSGIMINFCQEMGLSLKTVEAMLDENNNTLEAENFLSEQGELLYADDTNLNTLSWSNYTMETENFIIELGPASYTNETNITSFTWSNSTTAEDNNNQCFTIPVTVVFLFGALIMELTKLFFALIRQRKTAPLRNNHASSVNTNSSAVPPIVSITTPKPSASTATTSTSTVEASSSAEAASTACSSSLTMALPDSLRTSTFLATKASSDYLGSVTELTCFTTTKSNLITQETKILSVVVDIHAPYSATSAKSPVKGTTAAPSTPSSSESAALTVGAAFFGTSSSLPTSSKTPTLVASETSSDYLGSETELTPNTTTNQNSGHKHEVVDIQAPHSDASAQFPVKGTTVATLYSVSNIVSGVKCPAKFTGLTKQSNLFKRSESFPKYSNPVRLEGKRRYSLEFSFEGISLKDESTLVRGMKDTSLPSPAKEEGIIENEVIAKKEMIENIQKDVVKKQRTVNTRSSNTFKDMCNISKELCMRTGSFITAMGL